METRTIPERATQPTLDANRRRRRLLLAGVAGALLPGTARAAPDSYTILVGKIADQAVAPAVYPQLDYDPRKDFAPITQYAETATLLVANTPDEFAAFIRKEQEEIAVLAKAAGARVE